MKLFKLWGENYMKTPQLFRSVNPSTHSDVENVVWENVVWYSGNWICYVATMDQVNQQCC